MHEAIRQLFSDNFAPHVYCLRNTGVVGFDAVSDCLIALAYMMIPMALMNFFRRRRDLQFSWIFALFGVFIFSCGFTHILSVWTLWHPIYRVEALVKIITAMSSLLTAVMLWKILPQLVRIPSPQALQIEIEDRKKAEDEIRRLYALLETRVADRTAALFSANQALLARERALERVQERLKLALDAGRVGVWDYDVTTGQFTADDRCRQVFGLLHNEDLGYQEFVAALHPDDSEAVLSTLRSVSSVSDDGRYQIEFRTIGAADCVPRHVQLHGRAIFEGVGAARRPCRYLGVMTDITSRMKEQEELMCANEDLRQFAFAAAHDLQEPLRNVAVSAQLIALKYRSQMDNEGQELLNQSTEGAQRVNQMLRDLLSYLRVVDREDADGKPSTSASAALDEALANLRSRIQESGAQIQAHSLPVVAASRLHVSQLFQNLLGNSIKYRKPGEAPLIRVSALQQKNRWLFEVADNGIGFNQIYADKIFGMFKRLNGRHEYPGNGVGLAICSRIIRHYGGSIWAESQPGEGAIFRFTLPG